MSILSSLVKAYERLPDAPRPGYSLEKIGYLISLNEDGTVAHVVDVRTGEGRKKIAPLKLVPQPTKRTAGIAPNYLWDKTSYVLGVTAAEGKRTADEHAAFIKRHVEAFENTDDIGLKALALFLQSWSADQFVAPVWSDEMKDQNVVFALEAERLKGICLHDRPAARALWARLNAEGAKNAAICLVSGENGPVARLHPALKGVWGAQSSGASIVSFNLDAFTSYGHEQGDNAPVSEASAFAYTTALNIFLERGSGHRIQIGDASTVFWADAEEADKILAAQAVFESMFDEPDDAKINEAMEAGKVGELLRKLREGEPIKSFAPGLTEGVRFYVLALAPNAARLSIRFYLDNDFAAIAENYQRFIADMRVEPPPRDPHPALWKYLLETAVLNKRENVPPNLAGEWLRAILTGNRYPMTLLSAVLMRLRADKDVNPLRVQILKALLIRNYDRKDAPVALEADYPNRGYQLGRLFAVYERIQSDALGPKVNATIKDKFYGSASAQPRKVFALLDKGSANHLSKLGKQAPGRKIQLEKLVGEIMGAMSPSADPYPITLAAEDQALFGLGYYHQRSEFFKSTKTETEIQEDAAQ